MQHLTFLEDRREKRGQTRTVLRQVEFHVVHSLHRESHRLGGVCGGRTDWIRCEELLACFIPTRDDGWFFEAGSNSHAHLEMRGERGKPPESDPHRCSVESSIVIPVTVAGEVFNPKRKAGLGSAR